MTGNKPGCNTAEPFRSCCRDRCRQTKLQSDSMRHGPRSGLFHRRRDTMPVRATPLGSCRRRNPFRRANWYFNSPFQDPVKGPQGLGQVRWLQPWRHSRAASHWKGSVCSTARTQALCRIRTGPRTTKQRELRPLQWRADQQQRSIPEQVPVKLPRDGSALGPAGGLAIANIPAGRPAGMCYNLQCPRCSPPFHSAPNKGPAMFMPSLADHIPCRIANSVSLDVAPTVP